MEEEARELAFEVKENLKGADNARAIIEEGLDLVVTVCGIFAAIKARKEEITTIAISITSKNNCKTESTHLLDPINKKIRRKTSEEVLEELNGEDYKVGYLLIEKPKWLIGSIGASPITTSDDKCVLARAAESNLKNNKFIFCCVVFPNDLISPIVESIPTDMQCVHDKELLVKTLQNNGLLPEETPSDARVGEDISDRNL
jgi:hypothetical protein